MRQQSSSGHFADKYIIVVIVQRQLVLNDRARFGQYLNFKSSAFELFYFLCTLSLSLSFSCVPIQPLAAVISLILSVFYHVVRAHHVISARTSFQFDIQCWWWGAQNQNVTLLAHTHTPLFLSQNSVLYYCRGARLNYNLCPPHHSLPLQHQESIWNFQSQKGVRVYIVCVLLVNFGISSLECANISFFKRKLATSLSFLSTLELVCTRRSSCLLVGCVCVQAPSHQQNGLKYSIRIYSR